MLQELFAPWEIQHGYASDRFLRQETSRLGEFEIKRRPALTPERKLLSHSQWSAFNRRVCAPDSQAHTVVVTKTGHRLCLFTFEQTKEKI